MPNLKSPTIVPTTPDDGSSPTVSDSHLQILTALTPDEVAAAVKDLLRIAAEKMAGFKEEEQYIDPAVVAALNRGIELLRQSTADCLAPLEFKPVPQFGLSPRAIEFLNIGLKSEDKKIKELEEKKATLKPQIENLLLAMDKYRNAKKSKNPDLRVAAAGDAIPVSIITDSISERLARHKTMRLSDLATFIANDELVKIKFPSLNEKEVTATLNENENEGLQKALALQLKDAPGPSETFVTLQKLRASYSTMRPDLMWQKEHTGAHTGAVADDHFKKLAKTANELAMALLGRNFQLDPTVVQENDVAKLRQMALLPPVTAAQFNVVKSAIAKLELIHLLLIIEAEVDFDKNADAGSHLANYLLHISHKYDEGLAINPPRDRNNLPTATLENTGNRHVLVDRIEVDRNGKRAQSIAVKLLTDDYITTQRIFDTNRARIFSRYEDAYDEDGTFNEAKFTKWVLSLLAVLVSILGDDIDRDRIRCSIKTGGTNPDSTGRHRGIQITINYKYHSWKNGLYPNGEPKTETTPVEIQLLAFCTPEENEADHQIYAANKTASVADKLTVSLGFKDFILDLMTILDTPKYDIGIQSSPESNGLPDKLRDYVERRTGHGNTDVFPEKVNVEKLLMTENVPRNNNNERVALLLLEIITNPLYIEANSRTLHGIFLENTNLLRRSITYCEQWRTHHPESKYGLVIQEKARHAKAKLNSYLAKSSSLTAALQTESFPSTSKLIWENRQTRSGSRKVVVLQRKSLGADGRPYDERLHWSGPVARRREDIVNDREILIQSNYYETHQLATGETREKLEYIMKCNTDGSTTCYMALDAQGKQIVPIFHASTKAEGMHVSLEIREYDYEIADGKPNAILRSAASKNLDPSLPFTPERGMDEGNRLRYKLLDDFLTQKAELRKKSSIVKNGAGAGKK